MFNFTTTTVINSNLDSTGKNRFIPGENSFHVLRVNNFKQANVEAVYLAAPVDPVKEILTIDFSNIDIKKGDQFKIDLYVGLTQASHDSRYANDLNYKGKPFTVQFIGKDKKDKTLKTLVENINKYQLLVYGEKQLTATVDGEKLVITATTEYQRFRNAVVAKYSPDSTMYPYSGQYDVLWDLNEALEKAVNSVLAPDEKATDKQKEQYVEDVAAAKAEIIKPGVEGFGTYDYIMHNLRLPTFERTRAYGVNQDETPAFGAKYCQITIHYCVKRGPLGLNAVGDLVTSRTTHVFFVNMAVAAEFIMKMKQGLNLDINANAIEDYLTKNGYKSTEEQRLSGDLNGDGVVDVADANILINIILGNQPATDDADLPKVPVKISSRH